jgi:hypothetical protein
MEFNLHKALETNITREKMKIIRSNMAVKWWGGMETALTSEGEPAVIVPMLVPRRAVL